MNYAPPSSQKAAERPISFFLNDGASIGAFVEPVVLSVPPEALSRQDPSRINVVQTLGGAWADNFGPGLAGITISGHTGWRRDAGLSLQSNGQDGVDRFLRLRDTVFSQWHSRRAAAVLAGRDPNDVHLVLTDALDRFTVTVAPQSFVLQRSRSRPLLMQYQISLSVLYDGVAPSGASLLGGVLGGDVLRSLGLTSLADSIDKIEGYANQISRFIDYTIGTPVRAFMATSAAIYRRVDSAVRSADGIASSLVGIAQNVARAGMNVFRTIGLIASLPERAKALVNGVAAAYTNVFCLLRNAIKNLPQYDSYDSLYGASNCSSTSGGSPVSSFAGVNTFAAIQRPAEAFGITVSPEAQAGLSSLARADVAMAPPSILSLLSSVGAVNGGLVAA